MIAYTLTVISFENEVLTLRFKSQKDLDSFKTTSGAPDTLRNAIVQVLGVQVKFKPQIAEAHEIAAESSAEPVAKPDPKSRNKMVDESARYGESVLREVLGAEPINDSRSGK